MAIIKKNINIEVELDGRDIAKTFWKLSSDDQACFFDELSKFGTDFDFQLS